MQVVGREQCPKCAEEGRDNSGDNLAVYEDDSTYCFSCGYFTKEKPEEDYSGLLQGEIQDIPNRGLNKNICSKFGYSIGRYSGFLGKKKVKNTPVHIATYCDALGSPVAQKIRDSEKNMASIGKASERVLYGQWLFEPSPNIFITVVEGEIDALTVAQEVRDKHGNSYPVVSVTDGAQGAKTCLKKNLAWLQKWKYVVLAFDNDEAGQAASKACLELFEPGRVRIVNWPLKDANEMLLNNRSNEIQNLLFNAIKIKPDGVVTFKDVREKVLQRPTPGYKYPWDTLTNFTYGMKSKELITILGGAGLGKTELVMEIFLNYIKTYNLNCGIMSFEQSPEETFLRSIGKVLGGRLHVPDCGEWDATKIGEIGDSVLDDKLFCYERNGPVSWDNVRNMLLYYVKSLDCRLIVIDNLSSIAAMFDTDERRGIDKTMLELASLAMTLDITIILVAHLSRPTGGEKTAYENGAKVTLHSARGSDAIGNQSTFVLSVERNAMSENEGERLVTTVRCLKDRKLGLGRGKFFDLHYNPSTGRLEESPI